jgi:hypothetical protein
MEPLEPRFEIKHVVALGIGVGVLAGFVTAVFLALQ